MEKGEKGLRLYKVIFVPRALIMNTSSHMSFLGKICEKSNIQIFRVAIFQLNLQILNLMGTLIKKLTPDSAYLWLKTLKNEIYFSGLPEKACQGCHISEGPR